MHMSSSSHCRFKFVKLSAAISFLLTSNLYAATIGSTHVNSNQYQPLAATIEVSDIDPDNFSVSLANRQIYQQMGLTPKPTMSVNFVKTGANSGKVIINTSSALTEPFADVVLTVNDAGTQIVVPKTLLLPLGGATQPQTMPNKPKSQTVGNTKTPDLPVVSQTSDITLGQPILGKPLPINSSLPPPLRIASVTPQIDTDEVSETQAASNTNDTANYGDNIQTLKIDINRTYRHHQEGTLSDLSQQSNNANTQILAQQDMTPDHSTTETSQSNTAAVDSTEQTNVTTPDKASTVQANAKAKPKTTEKRTDSVPDIALGSQTYTVQKNDNLWTIANQIAHENNMSVETVMQQIKSYNQDAFIDGDISLLKANAKLKLPDYKVIPSKLGIKAAIAARNSQQNTNHKPTNNAKNIQGNNTTKHDSKAPTTNKTITQPLPRPQVTLVTPGRSGSATGSQTTQSATGTGLNGELLTELKSTRQLTAKKAQRVQTLSKQLAESTNRMHLQNQRLAELEQRLKDLRNNK